MLYENFETLKDFLGEGIYRDKCSEAEYITENLAEGVSLRPYQEEAVGRYLYYLDDYPKRIEPTHLMFNMATGAGKTVVMAGLILDLYRRGYRNFVFFTRLGHIVEKTKLNFLVNETSKYLFGSAIQLNGKTIEVKSVRNFSDADPDHINIHFTTTSGLHFKLNNPSEDSITYEEFAGEK